VLAVLKPATTNATNMIGRIIVYSLALMMLEVSVDEPRVFEYPRGLSHGLLASIFGILFKGTFGAKVNGPLLCGSPGNSNRRHYAGSRVMMSS